MPDFQIQTTKDTQLIKDAHDISFAILQWCYDNPGKTKKEIVKVERVEETGVKEK